MEQRLASLMRWNALAMVVPTNQAYGELGVHIASYASIADLFEVGHHFFRTRMSADGGNLLLFQPHSAPGVYARAFLEGSLSESDLMHFRREITAPQNGTTGSRHPEIEFLLRPAIAEHPDVLDAMARAALGK